MEQQILPLRYPLSFGGGSDPINLQAYPVIAAAWENTRQRASSGLNT